MTSPSLEDNGELWVLDDSPLELERVRRFLEPHYRIVTFNDGANLLEALASGGDPDLLLLDSQLPGVSGLEVCRFVRTSRDEVSLPVCMLTSLSAREDMEEGFAAGVNDYLAKPFHQAELLARLRSLIRVRSQGQALRHAELALRRSEEQLRAISDALPVLVSFVDTTETFVSVNRAYEIWFGIPAAAMVGRTVAAVIGESAYAALGPQVKRALAGETFTFEAYDVAYPNAGARDIRATFIPRIRDGEVLGYVTLLEDISEPRRLAAEKSHLAAQHLETLENQAVLEKQLLGIVSHDLRTPLTAIKMSAELLIRRGMDEKSMRFIERIQRSATRASELVADLLDFTQARIGGGIKVEPRSTDLFAVLRTLLEEVDTTETTSRLEVALEGSATGDFDPGRITQVLQNLLTNALKYSPPESKVKIRGRADELSVEICFHNGGEPIPPERLPTLFESMQRGPEKQEVGGRSVGLGLYIVQHLVEAHHGTVAVSSNPADGTTFTVTLPKRQP